MTRNIRVILGAKPLLISAAGFAICAAIDAHRFLDSQHHSHTRCWADATDRHAGVYMIIQRKGWNYYNLLKPNSHLAQFCPAV